MLTTNCHRVQQFVSKQSVPLSAENIYHGQIVKDHERGEVFFVHQTGEAIPGTYAEDNGSLKFISYDGRLRFTCLNDTQ